MAVGGVDLRADTEVSRLMSTFPLPLTEGRVQDKDQTYEVSASWRTSLPAGDPIGADNDVLCKEWHGMQLSRITKILTVALSPVLLAACGGNSGGSGGSAESPGGPGALPWFLWSGSAG